MCIFKRALSFIALSLVFMGGGGNLQAKETAFDFSFEALNSQEIINLSDFKGNVLLVVNTASQCGFTDQYKGLELLYQKYKDMGFDVIAVPSNDFGNQEPGTQQEIAQFCKCRYGITFPVTAKYSVCGKNKHPFYRWAKKTLGFGTAPKWNFHKYLINRRGQLVGYFHSTTTPESPLLVEAIEQALKDQEAAVES